MKKILEYIIQNNMTCYFVSPHLDDAMLSAGQVLTELSGKVPLTVINVFTQADGKPYTMSAKVTLKNSGFPDARELYRARRQEDKEAFLPIDANILNLGFVEGLYRKKNGKVSQIFGKILPEFKHVYPTYRMHIASGKISKHDTELQRKIQDELLAIIGLKKNAVIFCPMGIGNHVDHVLVRDVCKKTFSNIIYWSDFPYNQSEKKMTIVTSFREFSLAATEEKNGHIKKYKTQFSGMFPTLTVPEHQEKYYVEIEKRKGNI